jgi:hypothetical protein
MNRRTLFDRPADGFAPGEGSAALYAGIPGTSGVWVNCLLGYQEGPFWVLTFVLLRARLHNEQRRSA